MGTERILRFPQFSPEDLKVAPISLLVPTETDGAIPVTWNESENPEIWERHNEKLLSTTRLQYAQARLAMVEVNYQELSSLESKRLYVTSLGFSFGLLIWCLLWKNGK